MSPHFPWSMHFWGKEKPLVVFQWVSLRKVTGSDGVIWGQSPSPFRISFRFRNSGPGLTRTCPTWITLLVETDHVSLAAQLAVLATFISCDNNQLCLKLCIDEAQNNSNVIACEIKHLDGPHHIWIIESKRSIKWEKEENIKFFPWKPWLKLDFGRYYCVFRLCGPSQSLHNSEWIRQCWSLIAHLKSLQQAFDPSRFAVHLWICSGLITRDQNFTLLKENRNGAFGLTLQVLSPET